MSFRIQTYIRNSAFRQTFERKIFEASQGKSIALARDIYYFKTCSQQSLKYIHSMKYRMCDKFEHNEPVDIFEDALYFIVYS